MAENEKGGMIKLSQNVYQAYKKYCQINNLKMSKNAELIVIEYLKKKGVKLL